MLILASASPRRHDLLSQLGVPFIVEAAHIDESRLPGERPPDYTLRMARAKAATIAARHPGRAEGWVLAADTTVVVGDDILNKPKDRADALAMIGRLQGATHVVITSVALTRAGETRPSADCSVFTRVTFKPLTAREIAGYCATPEPYDKAGGYAAQGIGASLILRVEGSYTNVVGLPLAETVDLLVAHGVWPGLGG